MGWIVAIRLLTLARRTRELPERLLGFSLLLAVAIGYPLRIVGPLSGSPALDWLGNACVSAGFALFAVFVQRVFRPEAAWAKTLALVLVAAFVAQSALCTPERGQAPTFWQMTLAAIAYGWGALEAGLTARRLHRQLALGLGDRIVHNRFQLFTGIGCAVVAGALANAAAIASDLTPLQEPLVLIATTVSGTTMASCTLLAFAPPRFYRERLTRTAA
ncbi:MAG: hypothetical protein FJ091_09955 [Deltaproteobacteria bacterium]|nr:hypothetical protein [Deltaproteobacteria bacterium]